MNERQRLSQWFAQASRSRSFQVVVGALSGVLIIILAVAISALIFRAYGWGLFVLTPFIVGITTGFLVNRQELQSMAVTNGIVRMTVVLPVSGRPPRQPLPTVLAGHGVVTVRLS